MKLPSVRNRGSIRIAQLPILPLVLVSVLLALAGCFGDGDEPVQVSSISEELGTEDPCAFADVEDASGVLFGESPGEGQTGEIQDSFIGCSDRLDITVDDQAVGSMSVVSQVFADPEVGDPGVVDDFPPVDQLEWFQPGSLEDFNEVIDPYVEPIAEPWKSGESFLLDGLFRNRDMYIVGAWGEVNGFGFGIAFKVTAAQEYYDQPLLYNEYCDVTDLDSGCIVSADVLYKWMIEEYLPQIADKLSTG